MANLTIKELSAMFRKNGAYSLFEDKSATPLPSGDNPLYLQVIQSRYSKAPINRIVRVDSLEEWEIFFGKRDRKMERNGVFSWIHASWLLQQGSIYVLNLRDYDNDQEIEMVSMPLESGDLNLHENVKVKYKDLFTRAKFWTLDKESLDVGSNPINFGTISDKKTSMFVTKSNEDIFGKFETVADYLAANPEASIDYIPKETLLNELLIDVWVFDRDLTADSARLDPVLSTYLGSAGQIKGGIENGLFNLSRSEASRFLTKYTGTLVPEILDNTGATLFIETLMNADSAATGIFCHIDLEEVQKYIDHDLDEGAIPNVMGHLTPNFSFTTGSDDIKVESTNVMAYSLNDGDNTEDSTFINAEVLKDITKPEVRLEYNLSDAELPQGVSIDHEIDYIVDDLASLPTGVDAEDADIALVLSESKLYEYDLGGTSWDDSDIGVNETAQVKTDPRDQYYTTSADEFEAIPNVSAVTSSVNVTYLVDDISPNETGTLGRTVFNTGYRVAVQDTATGLFAGNEHTIMQWDGSSWQKVVDLVTNDTYRRRTDDIDSYFTYDGTTTHTPTATAVQATTGDHVVIDVVSNETNIRWALQSGDKYLLVGNPSGDFVNFSEFSIITYDGTNWSEETAESLDGDTSNVLTLNGDVLYSFLPKEIIFTLVPSGHVSDDDQIFYGDNEKNQEISYVKFTGQFGDEMRMSVITMEGVENTIKLGGYGISIDGSLARVKRHYVIGKKGGVNVHKTEFDKPLYSTEANPVNGTFAMDESASVDVWSGDYFIIRSLEDRTGGRYIPKVVKGAPVKDTQFVNKTKARQNDILNFMESDDIKSGIVDRRWGFKFIVDSFKTYIEPQAKAQITRVCDEYKHISAILSLPSVKDFMKSTDPVFKDSQGVFSAEYITKGSNEEISSSTIFSLPSEQNGDWYGNWVGDSLIYNDGFSKTLVPANAAQALNFGALHITIGKYVSDTPAGTPNGVISVSNAGAVDYEWTDKDLEYLHPWGINTIVSSNGSLFVDNAGTGRNTVVSQLSQSGNAQMVIEIGREGYNFLKPIVNNRRNNVTTRAEIKQKFDSICQPYVAIGALGRYTNIVDTSNNTKDIRAAGYVVVTTELYTTSNIRIAVHQTKVYADDTE